MTGAVVEALRIERARREVGEGFEPGRQQLGQVPNAFPILRPEQRHGIGHRVAVRVPGGAVQVEQPLPDRGEGEVCHPFRSPAVAARFEIAATGPFELGVALVRTRVTGVGGIGDAVAVGGHGGEGVVAGVGLAPISGKAGGIGGPGKLRSLVKMTVLVTGRAQSQAPAGHGNRHVA